MADRDNREKEPGKPIEPGRGKRSPKARERPRGAGDIKKRSKARAPGAKGRAEARGTQAQASKPAKARQKTPAEKPPGRAEPSLFSISKVRVRPATRLRQVSVATGLLTAAAALLLWLLELEASNDFFLAAAVAIPVLMLVCMVQLLDFELHPTRDAAARRSLAAVFALIALGEAGALYALAAGSSNAASVALAAAGVAAPCLMTVGTLALPRPGKDSAG